MSNQTSLREIKERLSDFLNKIESIEPKDMEVSDVDEWIAILDELEKKVQDMKAQGK